MTMLRSSRLKPGFSMVELLVAVVLMSLSLLSFLWMNSLSSRSAMDARLELLVMTLSREPIDVLQSFGYQWLLTNHEGPGMEDLHRRLAMTAAHYPAETALFSRTIAVDKGPDRGGLPAYFSVTVTIKKARQSFWSRPEVSLKGLIWQTPR